jgi:Flp pilus assembly protein TadG
MGLARRAARDDGAAAVEFAIVAPLALALLFWTFEFGWQLWELQAAQSAAREVVRLASLGIENPAQFETDAACVAYRNGARGARLTRVRLAFNADPGGTQPLASPVDGYATVTLTYRSLLAGLLPTPLAGADGTFTAAATSRIETMDDTDPLDFAATAAPCS